MFGKRPGAVQLPHLKGTAGKASVRMPAPETLTLLMAQHIGAPATPLVGVGDRVCVGQRIGECAGYVSSPVFSPVSGTVAKTEQVMLPSGRACTALIIKNDGKYEISDEVKPPVVKTLDEFISAVRDSGLVGLGGAGFPAHVKLEAKKKGPVDAVIINAAECEPYITSDTRTVYERRDELIAGILAVQKFIEPGRIVFGLERSNGAAADRLEADIADIPGVSVCRLPSSYPQGGEKILIYNTIGRTVPEGGLPADVGVIVLNITSLAHIGRYLHTGMPLIEKCITVDGTAVREPKNIIAPIGTPINELIEFAGGLREPAGKVLLGGPMMGMAIYDMSYPVTKTTNGITVLAREPEREMLPCIRCGSCVAHCPMGLTPTAINTSMEIGDPAERAAALASLSVGLCIECGCCSYVCPSSRPLVQTNRLAKAYLREYSSRTAGLK